MKICLIKPPVLHKESSVSLMPSPPLGLAYIAAALKNSGHSVQVIDATAEGFNDVEEFQNEVYLFGLNSKGIINLIEKDTDIICFSFMFTNNWLYDRYLVKEVKKKFPKSVLIAGGEHVTAAPEYSLKQARGLDFIVIGEGEATIVDLVTALSTKSDLKDVGNIAYLKEEDFIIQKGGKVSRIKEIEGIAWPAWELFPLEKYFSNKVSYGVFRGNTLPVMASRGCPYECTFCSSPQMWGRNYSIRSPKDFVDEIEHLYKRYNVTNFELYDLTAIIYKTWIIDTAKEIINRGLKITYQIPAGTRAEAIDYEVAQWLYKSGCKNITYAPESGSEKMLKKIKKKVKLEKMLDSIKHSSKANLNIKLNIIIGYPDETHLDILKTIWFLVKCSWYGANDTSPAVFSPYPGSNLFERLIKEKKLDIYDDNYLMEIINSYDLWPGKVYSNNVSPIFVRFYSVITMIIFYMSNYLFRPHRFFNTMKNIYTKNYESRAELALSKILFKIRAPKQRKRTITEVKEVTSY